MVKRRLRLEQPFGARDDDGLEAAQDAEALGRKREGLGRPVSQRDQPDGRLPQFGEDPARPRHHAGQRRVEVDAVAEDSLPVIRKASDEVLLRLFERTAAVVQPVPAGEVNSFQESRDLLGRQHPLVRGADPTTAPRRLDQR